MARNFKLIKCTSSDIMDHLKAPKNQTTGLQRHLCPVYDNDLITPKVDSTSKEVLSFYNFFCGDVTQRLEEQQEELKRTVTGLAKKTTK